MTADRVEHDVDDWFAGRLKPDATGSGRDVFEIVRSRIDALGPCTMDIKGQISFGVDRKFCWVWLYNVTNRSPDGILHLQLAIGERIDDRHVRSITKVSGRRWNHQVVLRTRAEARSAWLGKLIATARSSAET